MTDAAIDAEALRRDLSAHCSVYPAGWPNRPLSFDPADFSQPLPQGYGFSTPLVVRPWDRDVQAAADAQSVYGWRGQHGDIVRNAPRTLPRGGVVYFDDPRSDKIVDDMLRAVGIDANDAEFAVFCGGADDPEAECYLHQVRMMPHPLLGYVFRAKPEEVLPPHPASVSAIVKAFIAREKKHWNDDDTFSGKLSGLAGGDGDWAKEALAFGLWVENGEHRIYRLWSRAWLVTK